MVKSFLGTGTDINRIDWKPRFNIEAYEWDVRYAVLPG